VSDQTHRQLWRDAIRDCDDPELDPLALAVAMALDRHMDAAGRTHTGQHKLARYAKLRTTETVVDRVAVLERTGWLTVARPAKSGGRTHYQATIPADLDHPTRSDGPNHPTRSDGSPGEPSDATDRRPSDATGPTVRHGRTDPVDPESSPRRDPARDEPERRPAEEEDLARTIEDLDSWADGPPAALWELMARRQLGLERAQDRGPTTSETGWLKATARAYAARHTDAALEVRADTEPGTEADYFVWALEPDLARRNWQIPDTPPEPEPDDRCSPEEARSIADAIRAQLGIRRRQPPRGERVTDPDDHELDDDEYDPVFDTIMRLADEAEAAAAAGDPGALGRFYDQAEAMLAAEAAG
jgi:hypothetical protein